MSRYTGPAEAGPTLLNGANFATYYPKLFAYTPTPRLLSYNARSYSCRAVSAELKQRSRRVKANMTSGMRYADVVCMQETKHQTPDFYHSFSAEWIVFRNPYYADSGPIDDERSDVDSGLLGTRLLIDEAAVKVVGDDGKVYAAKAGTDIFVRKSYARNFVLTHNIHKVGPKAIAAADALRLASSSSKRRSRSSARSPDIRSSKRPKGPSADGHRFLSLAEWVNTRYPVPSSDSRDVDQHNPVEADSNQFHR